MDNLGIFHGGEVLLNHHTGPGANFASCINGVGTGHSDTLNESKIQLGGSAFRRTQIYVHKDHGGFWRKQFVVMEMQRAKEMTAGMIWARVSGEHASGKEWVMPKQ